MEPRLIMLIKAQMQRLTAGRRYEIALDTLDQRSLHELHRFIVDAEQEALIKARRAQLTPWRRLP